MMGRRKRPIAIVSAALFTEGDNKLGCSMPGLLANQRRLNKILFFLVQEPGAKSAKESPSYSGE